MLDDLPSQSRSILLYRVNRRADILFANELDDIASPWLTMAEAADYLHISTRTVERRREAGSLRAVYCDRHWLTHREWLDDYAMRGGRGGDSANRSTLPPRGVA